MYIQRALELKAANEMQTAARQEFRIEGFAEPISHYADAVRFGDMLFISGIAALDGAGRVTAPDVVGQAEEIFRSLKKVLQVVGADFSDVLKVTVFLTDVADRMKINPVRQRYFGDARPASTLIGVSSLALPEMKIEIEAVVGLRRAAK
jgi:enamine deaminase RidA (YjgF/YER057c/UK114 family)